MTAKSPEHDTARETPSSKQTVAVRTYRSDPPPSPYPHVRPAAGAPAAANREVAEPPGSRAAKTLPGARARPVPDRRSNDFLIGTAVFVLLLSATFFVLHGR
jgi:hypothetical protein